MKKRNLFYLKMAGENELIHPLENLKLNKINYIDSSKLPILGYKYIKENFY